MLPLVLFIYLITTARCQGQGIVDEGSGEEERSATAQAPAAILSEDKKPAAVLPEDEKPAAILPEDEKLAATLPEDEKPAAQCERAIPCTNDDECFGVKLSSGMCVGLAVGKCDCAACLSLIRCDDDDACGGLKGACVDGYCDCDEGFRHNGFKSTHHALRSFCNIENCKGDGDSKTEGCYGLPCNPGLCICPYKE